jgi:hypothetical protein
METKSTELVAATRSTVADNQEKRSERMKQRQLLETDDMDDDIAWKREKATTVRNYLDIIMSRRVLGRMRKFGIVLAFRLECGTVVDYVFL